MAGKGRLRWNIENEGVNRQKNWQGEITHACSFNANALKNHYLIYQIADFIRQLYKHFSLEKEEITRTKKNLPFRKSVPINYAASWKLLNPEGFCRNVNS
ncbi:MAG: hypothetical protein K2J60_10615 [Acetatifactor sp.]|nr:hypothetical protein [Acetatifactor sp.]